MIDKIGPVIASLVALAIGAVVTVLMVNASGALYDELHDHGDINGEAFTVLYTKDVNNDEGVAQDRGAPCKAAAGTSGASNAGGVTITCPANTTPVTPMFTLQGSEVAGTVAGQTLVVTSGTAKWEEAMEAASRLSGLNNVVTSLLPFVVSLSFIVTVFAKSFLRQGSMGNIKDILMGEIVVLVVTLVAIYVAPSLFQFIEGLYFAVSSGAPMLQMFGSAVNSDRGLRAVTGKGLYERGKGYFGKGRAMGM